jgi:hypothetical protein
MNLPGETTLAELHEIYNTCIECFKKNDCDFACPYWQLNVNVGYYMCTFRPNDEPHEWILPDMIEMED